MFTCHLENEKDIKMKIASGHTIDDRWLYGNSKLCIFADGGKQSYRTFLKTHLGALL